MHVQLPAPHPHLRLRRTLVPVPRVEPGDYVVWHPDAVHAADSYAAETYPYALITRNQAWRRGVPTEGQLKFLNQFRDADRKLTETDVTKGKATDMITKPRQGARGRFATIDANRRRREKQVLADEQRTAREKVSIGPLAA